MLQVEVGAWPSNFNRSRFPRSPRRNSVKSSEEEASETFGVDLGYEIMVSDLHFSAVSNAELTKYVTEAVRGKRALELRHLLARGGVIAHWYAFMTTFVLECS